MKKYYVKSKIEGKEQINEVSEVAFNHLKKLDGTYPLQMLRESTEEIVGEDGVIEFKDVVKYETMQIPFELEVVEED